MFKIIKQSRRFTRKVRGKLTFENINKYIKDIGYQLILFDENTSELRNLGLTEVAENRNGFTYCGELKIIFIRKSLDEQEKLHLLIHEIGHIMLGHLETDFLTKQTKEKQAEAFVNFSFLYTYINSIKAKLFIFFVLTFMLIYSIIGSYTMYDITMTRNEKTHAVTIDVSSEETYYVTPTGKKYHIKDCIYAKNSTPVSVQYAIDNYFPCKVCQPNINNKNNSK